MKLALVSASLVSLALLTGSGFAATAAKTPAATAHAASASAMPAQTDTAMIKLIDVKAHQITLDDGKTFALPKGWRLHGYKTGEKVKVIYQDHMGSMLVTKISKA